MARDLESCPFLCRCLEATATWVAAATWDVGSTTWDAAGTWAATWAVWMAGATTCVAWATWTAAGVVDAARCVVVAKAAWAVRKGKLLPMERPTKGPRLIAYMGTCE